MYSINEFNNLYHLNEEKDNKKLWSNIDKLNTEHLLFWGERLTKTRFVSNNNPNDWLKMIDIIRLGKNKIELTQKQKRFLAMNVVNYWNDLSVMYVL